MRKVSYDRHRFPAQIIQYAVWLYFRFPLSYRDVEELLAERGIDVTYETVRRWALKFGLAFAYGLRRQRPRSDCRWHLDEVFVSINGKRMYLWRAVDSEGEVLDILVQPRRDKKAALKLMHRLLKKQGYAPDQVITDRLPSYGSALHEIGMSAKHAKGLRKNNRAENAHFLSGNGSGACNGSNPRDRLRDFCQFTPPSTTPSTFSAISSPAALFVSSAVMRRTHGVPWLSSPDRKAW
jgi:putative transposase